MAPQLLHAAQLKLDDDACVVRFHRAYADEQCRRNIDIAFATPGRIQNLNLAFGEWRLDLGFPRGQRLAGQNLGDARVYITTFG